MCLYVVPLYRCGKYAHWIPEKATLARLCPEAAKRGIGGEACALKDSHTSDYVTTEKCPRSSCNRRVVKEVRSRRASEHRSHKVRGRNAEDFMSNPATRATSSRGTTSGRPRRWVRVTRVAGDRGGSGIVLSPGGGDDTLRWKMQVTGVSSNFRTKRHVQSSDSLGV